MFDKNPEMARRQYLSMKTMTFVNEITDKAEIVRMEKDKKTVVEPEVEKETVEEKESTDKGSDK